MRSVLARATKMLARSGLILAVLPVRAAAIPQAEGPPRLSACELSAAEASVPAQDGLSAFAGAFESR
jgi:hypothetical protein